MVHLPQKNTGVISHPYISIMATFLCSQIGCYGMVQLHDLFIMQCQAFPSPNYAPPLIVTHNMGSHASFLITLPDANTAERENHFELQIRIILYFLLT